MPRVKFANQTTEWEHLLATVETNQTALSFLEPQRLQLASVLDRAKDASLRQDAFKSQFQQATRDLEKALSEGQDLATRLRNGIRTQYGLRSEKLAEFGLQPRRKPQKSKQEPTPTPATPVATKP
jgi:23S rRNA G2069 N7-methylase RlmK/C1962 C5-methylase RlmI